MVPKRMYYSSYFLSDCNSISFTRWTSFKTCFETNRLDQLSQLKTSESWWNVFVKLGYRLYGSWHGHRALGGSHLYL